MKLRRRPSPLLVLLIPSLSSVAIAALARPGSNELPDVSLSPREAAVQAAAAGSAESTAVLVVPSSVSKSGVGTKDAPVDGKDGKPHDGPWVDLSDKDKKNEEKPLSGKKPPPKPLRAPDTHGTDMPEVNDGVMDDPFRASPKEGTTGTEGGVSEKNRERKAQEGQTGEKMEMRPESPKEAPPIPPSEEDKIKWGKEDIRETEKDALSERPKGAFGLEVRLSLSYCTTFIPLSPHSNKQPRVILWVPCHLGQL
jgi:hypothetical protein